MIAWDDRPERPDWTERRDIDPPELTEPVENDETKGWRLRETSLPARPMGMWRRLEVEADGGVYQCPHCDGEFKLAFARLCMRCGRTRAEWDALQLKEAA